MALTLPWTKAEDRPLESTTSASATESPSQISPSETSSVSEVAGFLQNSLTVFLSAISDHRNRVHIKQMEGLPEYRSDQQGSGHLREGKATSEVSIETTADRSRVLIAFLASPQHFIPHRPLPRGGSVDKASATHSVPFETLTISLINESASDCSVQRSSLHILHQPPGRLRPVANFRPFRADQEDHVCGLLGMQPQNTDQCDPSRSEHSPLVPTFV